MALPSRPHYWDNPADWPDHVRQLKADLAAAGIEEPTIYHLRDARNESPAAVAVLLDWLDHFDERVPAGDDRVATRVGLLHNLWGAKGDPVVAEALWRQLDRPLDRDELTFVARTLHVIGRPEDNVRAAEVIAQRTDDVELVNALLRARFDCPEMTPVVVDWLRHLDERVSDDKLRENVRLNLVANLNSPHTKGNRAAIDALLDQFTLPGSHPKRLRESAGSLVEQFCRAADLPRMAEVIRGDPGGPFVNLLIWGLRRIKNAPCREFVVSLLDDPRTRVDALDVLAAQRAPGVRDAVTTYLDDPDAATRQAAEKALAKLPD